MIAGYGKIGFIFEKIVSPYDRNFNTKDNFMLNGTEVCTHVMLEARFEILHTRFVCSTDIDLLSLIFEGHCIGVPDRVINPHGCLNDIRFYFCQNFFESIFGNIDVDIIDQSRCSIDVRRKSSGDLPRKLMIIQYC